MTNCSWNSSCEPRQTFKVLIKNVTKNIVKLNAHQIVGTADNHPDIMAESNITQAEILGLTTTMYTKCDKNVRDVNKVNKHLANSRLAALDNRYEEPFTSENVEIHAPKECHPHIRTLLCKHKNIWSEKLGNILATTHLVNLIPGTRPFKSTTFRAGPKSRKLEEFENKVQLPGGTIKHQAFKRRMGCPRPISTKERLMYTILRRLTETRNDDHQGFVLYTTNSRVYQLAW